MEPEAPEGLWMDEDEALDLECRVEALEAAGGPLRGLSLAGIRERRRPKAWWETWLLWHPGRWTDFEGDLAQRRAPEWWLRPACLNDVED